ncbi:class I SAM-dependent methyltransferase [Clostridiaceae bacterium M8S5]|nr:class I SAM-dependent methyltransferase [Clostridiaceae bacterium M8S5]
MIYRQTQLYRFLIYCNKADIEKKVLDCGAGGNCPPLGLFYEHGYETFGIELSEKQIEKANVFSKQHNIKLNMTKGDLRAIPFEDETFGVVYSYNTIFHMKKADIKTAIDEMKRVLQPEGLCYINFLSIDDFGYGEGQELGQGEFLQSEGEHEVIHTYFDINEAEKYFTDVDILAKEYRLYERIYEGNKIKQGYIEYIIQKRK